MTKSGDSDLHLTPEQSAGYLDGVLTAGERATVEAHLASCLECRDEVIAIQPLVRSHSPRHLILRATIAVGAAAAAVVLLVQPGPVPGPRPSPHRDPPQDASTVVVPRAPLGPTSRPLTVAWSPLNHAKRYRVLVFDAEGTILYRAEATDSALALPDSLGLSPSQSYFWKVEADTGWDRWVSSRLVEFSVGRTGEVDP